LRPKIVNRRAGLAGSGPIERELRGGDQILYWILDFGILRRACNLLNAIGFSSEARRVVGNDGRIPKSAAGLCDNESIIDGWLTALLIEALLAS
jgi:hypothetical protein